MKISLLFILFATAHFCGPPINSNQSDTSSNTAREPTVSSNEVPPASPLSPLGGNNVHDHMVSAGILNDKALVMPSPVYPASARALSDKDEVVVYVTVDKSGSVVTASAVKGNKKLRKAAEIAARDAKFDPLIIGGRRVRFGGVIVYRPDSNQK